MHLDTSWSAWMWSETKQGVASFDVCLFTVQESILRILCVTVQPSDDNSEMTSENLGTHSESVMEQHDL